MLELQAVTKKFGAFTALDSVDFSVNSGEIVGLLGENGAGKSTLLNLVSGGLCPDAGNLLWQGAPVQLSSPRDAMRLGIGVVHQHFMLVPSFSVAENMALQDTSRGVRFNAAKWEETVEGWAASLHWKINPRARIETLGVGERQRVEILKALFAGAPSELTSGSIKKQGARLLLLDEPTANLAPPEVDELFAVLRRLRDEGRGLVFVSHKLNEVLNLCDRVVVLRQGKITGESTTQNTSARQLAQWMVGRDLENEARPASTFNASPRTKTPRLAIENLSCGTLHDFSLQVRAGEIVGIAGVDGNGQAELVAALSGLRAAETGEWKLDGVRHSENLPASTLGLAVIPPDRQHVGLILDFDLAENMALHPALRAKSRRGLFFFDWNCARQTTRELMGRFDVRAPQTGERTLAAQLSGGNQQKIVIARALSFPHAAIVAADPTRGLDVGAMQFVHDQLRGAAEAGAGVLLISTDLEEIFALSHRIGVLYEGRLLPDASLLSATTSRETVGALMGGLMNVETAAA